MRIESSVTSLSWIPSEAVTGANKPMFEFGIAHYDNPPPDVIVDLVSSGNTLKANDLVAVEEIMPISSRLIRTIPCSSSGCRTSF